MATPGGKVLQEAVWRGSIPLEIRLNPADSRVFDQTDPYLIQFPRLSYLPFLFSRLHAFFSSVLINPHAPLNGIWLAFEGVPLRWYHPVGLLYDLFSGPEVGPKRDDAPTLPRVALASGNETVSDRDGTNNLPWQLVIHFSGYPYDQLAQIDTESKAVHDAFINTVKEADFLRYGTAKGIMSLSKDDSTAFYQSIIDHDLPAFNRVNHRLVPPQGSGAGQPLKHLPVRFYLPATPVKEEEKGDDGDEKKESEVAAGHLRIIQAPVTPNLPGTSKAQTLGQALHTIMPSLFPSSRTFIMAKPVLHGAVVPLAATLEDLLRFCAYSDGWLHISIEVMS